MNRALRKALTDRSLPDDATNVPMASTSRFVATSASTNNNVSVRRGRRQRRPPWNDDFADKDVDASRKEESSKTVKLGRSRRANDLVSRPPWNNDFAETETTSPPVTSSAAKRRPTDRNVVKARPPWNNDFNDAEIESSTNSSTRASAESSNRRAKSRSARVVESRPSWSDDFAESKNTTPRKARYVEVKSSGSSRRYRSDDARDFEKPFVEETTVHRRAATPPTERAPAGTTLLPCPSCGRTFNADALARHRPICRKAGQKRKPFDAAAKRAKALSASNNISLRKARTMVRKAGRDDDVALRSTPKKWKQQSGALRDAMRAAREYTSAKKNGRALPTAKKYSEPSDYVPCPHCGRTFNPTAAERHIPRCGESQKRRRMRGYRK